MRLATIRTDGGLAAARVEADELVLLPHTGVTELLREPDWRRLATADGPRISRAAADMAPVVRPSKTICVGQNYRAHIAEMGAEVPQKPTLFAKFAEALIGDGDAIAIPPESGFVDWEVELGVVIGRPTRRVPVASALDRIAGYTIVNDISMRDWQFQTAEWLQGKTWEGATPVGPVLVTPDELDATDLRLWCEVNGECRQDASTADMVFGVAELVSYISTFITLQPGDLIATGTPSGVGWGRSPKLRLESGDRVRTGIDGIGVLTNDVVMDGSIRS